MDVYFEKALDYIHNGYWKELYNLINEQPDLVFIQDEAGGTLLMFCARMGGSCEIIKKLVELGSDINHRAYDGSTALAAAIVGGSRYGLTTLPELRLLLDLGVNPNDIVDGGMPALHWAISQHKPEHLKILLEYGADIFGVTIYTPSESVDDIVCRMNLSEELHILRDFRNGK